jgi:hypothetical protein
MKGQLIDDNESKATQPRKGDAANSADNSADNKPAQSHTKSGWLARRVLDARLTGRATHTRTEYFCRESLETPTLPCFTIAL